MQKLVEYSGIPALREHLFANLADMHNATHAFRSARVSDSRSQLTSAVNAAISERAERITLVQKTTDIAQQALARDAEGPSSFCVELASNNG